MDQDISLIPEKEMVRNLPDETRKEICDELDVEKLFVKDCRDLAGQLGVSRGEVNVIWKGGGAGKHLSPTNNVLNWWQGRNDATVRRLVEILRDLKRDDVVEIIMKGYQQGTATVTGNVCQFTCSNYSLFYFPFLPNLQSAQNVCKQ